MKKPLALVAVGSDVLMVLDVAARGVYQVAITNNCACLKGSVTLVMKLPETSEPFGLACNDSQLYVADSSREGVITKLNLATLESDKLVRNGSEDCHTVHGLTVTKKHHLVFTNRGSQTVRLQLSQQDTHIEIQTIAGSGVVASKDGSCLSACFSQPTMQGEVHAIDEAVTSLNTISLSCDACMGVMGERSSRQDGS